MPQRVADRAVEKYSIEFGGANPTLNFNGGTLIARTVGGAMISTNNSTVLPVNPNIYVQAGGAMIDDNGVSAVMNALPLQHDPALGGTADGGLINFIPKGAHDRIRPYSGQPWGYPSLRPRAGPVEEGGRAFWAGVDARSV